MKLTNEKIEVLIERQKAVIYERKIDVSREEILLGELKEMLN